MKSKPDYTRQLMNIVRRGKSEPLTETFAWEGRNPDGSLKTLEDTMRIHAANSLKEAKMFVDDCKKGSEYEVGYRNAKWTSKFIGWRLDSDGWPRMKWEDTGDDAGTEWEAYIFNGKISVGSSADALIVYRKL